MRRNILLVLVFVGIQLIYPAATSQDRDLKQFSKHVRRELFGEKPTFSDCLTINSSHKRTLKYEVAPTRKPLWTVAILYEETVNGELVQTQHCMGVLINLKVVLTAAHCVFNKTISQLKVRANECHTLHKTDAESFQESRIEKHLIHNLYNLTHPQHDIALLLLEKSFNKSDCVETACLLPVHSWPVAARTECFTNGWISTKWRTSKQPPTNESTLTQFKMHVSPFRKCEKVMQNFSFGADFELSESFICAQGNAKRELFQANGGAPLFCKTCKTKGIIVIGILSWGFNTTLLPEAFTDIDKEKYWIRSTLKEWNFQYRSCKLED